QTRVSGAARGTGPRDLCTPTTRNQRPMARLECPQAGLGDLGASQPAFKDVDTVVHRGADAGDRQTPEDLLRSNVMGTYNVFEAAKRAGVKRVIFASSGATVSGAEREPPLSHIVNGRYDALG